MTVVNMMIHNVMMRMMINVMFDDILVMILVVQRVVHVHRIAEQLGFLVGNDFVLVSRWMDVDCLNAMMLRCRGDNWGRLSDHVNVAQVMMMAQGWPGREEGNMRGWMMGQEGDGMGWDED